MSSYEILDLLEYFNRQILENIFLNKENKDDEKIKILVNECIRLNKVIKDAIEYIETKDVDFVDVHYQQQDNYFNGLLEILKGEDKK